MLLAAATFLSPKIHSFSSRQCDYSFTYQLGSYTDLTWRAFDAACCYSSHLLEFGWLTARWGPAEFGFIASISLLPPLDSSWANTVITILALDGFVVRAARLCSPTQRSQLSSQTAGHHRATPSDSLVLFKLPSKFLSVAFSGRSEP